MLKLNELRPAVGKPVLLLTAAVMWIGVGTLLLSMAYTWLHGLGVGSAPVLAAGGVVAAIVIQHFGFLKVVDKNLARILPMEGKRCLFAFISWKSYLMAGGMIAMGITLRHSPIPKPYLAVVYIAIGLALILSSVRYLRVLLSQELKSGKQ